VKRDQAAGALTPFDTQVCPTCVAAAGDWGRRRLVHFCRGGASPCGGPRLGLARQAAGAQPCRTAALWCRTSQIRPLPTSSEAAC